jgi:DNA-binding MarR family transcriptional regulator
MIDDGRASVRTWLRLLTCSTLVEREVRARLREDFETTLPRFDLLAQLDLAQRDDVPGLTMSELSRRLMVTNGNLTSLVERLVQERLVRRVQAPSDRRISIIRLTPAGKRTIDALTTAHREWIAAVFADLNAADRDRLYELLGALRNSILAAGKADPSLALRMTATGET